MITNTEHLNNLVQDDDKYRPRYLEFVISIRLKKE
jgi:hypothetical protein